MTSVEFHQHTDGADDAELVAVCQVIAALYRSKKRVYVHTESLTHAQQIDECLWNFDLDSFVPHNLVGEGPKKPPPVQIGFENPPDQQLTTLVNCSESVPEFFSHFEQLVEFVPTEEKRKEAARERYRFYARRGYPLRHIQPK